MRVIALSTLKKFYEEYPDAEGAIKAWYAEAVRAEWKKSSDVKEKYGIASIVNKNRVVFNICGNKYRLVVHVLYDAGIVFIRFIGTHKEYDKINAEEI